IARHLVLLEVEGEVRVLAARRVDRAVPDGAGRVVPAARSNPEHLERVLLEQEHAVGRALPTDLEAYRAVAQDHLEPIVRAPARVAAGGVIDAPVVLQVLPEGAAARA